jgi:uncharacterized protein YceK
MRRLMFVLTVVCTLAGCATTLPTCDGKERRPINAPVKAEVSYPSCGHSA